MKYTKEDLMNTWGVVESKEHAEFIIEAAKSAGLDVHQYVGHYKRYRNGTMIMGWSALPYNDFIFEDDTLFIGAGKYPDEIDDNLLLNKKQITIPLPPKAKEWPKVGDEVLICDKVNLFELSRFNGEKCEVLGICSNGNDKVLTVKAKHQGVAAFNMGDWIKKPKTKQDLLIEDLHQKLLANNCSDEYLLACDIVQGKIEGLSYE